MWKKTTTFTAGSRQKGLLNYTTKNKHNLFYEIYWNSFKGYDDGWFLDILQAGFRERKLFLICWQDWKNSYENPWIFLWKMYVDDYANWFIR